VSKNDSYSDRLKPYFNSYHNLYIKLNGISPFQELITFLNLFYVCVKERPHYVLSFTIKPNVYLGILNFIFDFHLIQNVTGLGSMYNETGKLSKFILSLYAFTSKFSYRTFFQNQDDISLFKKNSNCCNNFMLLPGSGIDLDKFKYRFYECESIKSRKSTSFIFIGRILKEKGILDFIKAASIIKKSGLDCDFYILGFCDVINNSALSYSDLIKLASNNHVKYLGSTDDVRPFACNVDCFVYPSYYREGIPRSLIEAISLGLPVITTNKAGCREVLDEGKNGFFCNEKDPDDLSHKMLKFHNLSSSVKKSMSMHSRVKAESKFSESFIINSYLKSLTINETKAI
jgi:glycosyltransferase involved in cell wall biosynthesis